MGQDILVTVWDETGELEFKIPLKNYRTKLRNETFLFEFSPVIKTRNSNQRSSNRYQKPNRPARKQTRHSQFLECHRYWRFDYLNSQSFGDSGYYSKCQWSLDKLGHCGKLEPNYRFFELEIFRRIKDVIEYSSDDQDDIVTSLIKKTAKFVDDLAKKRARFRSGKSLPPIVRSNDQVFYTEHDLYKMFRSVINNLKQQFLEFKFDLEEFDFGAIIERLLNQDIVMRVTRDGQNLYL